MTIEETIRYGPTNTVAGRGGRPSKFDPIIQEPLIQRPNAFGLGASGYKKTFTYGRKIVGKLHPQQLLWCSVFLLRYTFQSSYTNVNFLHRSAP